MCKEGLRPHVSPKLTKCGITDEGTWKADKDCSLICEMCIPACAVTDFWIKGIEDKPLTFYHCSASPRNSPETPYKEYPLADCGKNSKCKQKDFETHFKEELRLEDMKEVLTKFGGPQFATDSEMATAETCLKMLTDIEAISYATCNDKDDCFSQSQFEFDYCSKDNDPRETTCKASKLTSRPTSKPSKTDALVNTTSKPTSKPSKTDAVVKTTSMPTSKPSKTDAPGSVDATVSKSNQKGNTATSGVAGNIGAVVYANSFSFASLTIIFNLN